MADASKQDAAKLKKMQTDLDKMKKVAKKLLQQKQQHEAQIKALKKENESKMTELKDEIDKKNKIISDFEKKVQQQRTCHIRFKKYCHAYCKHNTISG